MNLLLNLVISEENFQLLLSLNDYTYYSASSFIFDMQHKSLWFSNWTGPCTSSCSDLTYYKCTGNNYTRGKSTWTSNTSIYCNKYFGFSQYLYTYNVGGMFVQYAWQVDEFGTIAVLDFPGSPIRQGSGCIPPRRPFVTGWKLPAPTELDNLLNDPQFQADMARQARLLRRHF